MLRFRIAMLLRPLMSRLPVGSGISRRAYRSIVGKNRGFKRDRLYQQRLTVDTRYREFSDRFIRCRVRVDLVDWAGRAHYFTGVYYDRVVPMLVSRVLTPGDQYVDVGANRGLHVLAAARILGPESSLYAIEPNPAVLKELNNHLHMNGIEYCTVITSGAGDKASLADINHFAGGHSGSASLLTHGDIDHTSEIQIERLDVLLPSLERNRRTFVKIDTEGFDFNVIRGMGALLDLPAISVYSEVTPQWLEDAGASAAEMFQFMADHGFTAYLPSQQRRYFRRERLFLTKLLGPPRDAPRQYDVYFTKEQPPEDLISTTSYGRSSI